MKRLIHNALIAAIVAIMALTACDDGEFTVTSLAVYPTELEIEVGDSSRVVFALVYEGGDYDDPYLISPIWQSSDETIATVDSLGLVIALAVGQTRVTVDISGSEAGCDVTVIESTDDDDDEDEDEDEEEDEETDDSEETDDDSDDETE